ncbi:hypothetical protein IFM51744_09337 [Aspergillus udagawae]|nr:hypothetical protein IFM51744_09337 [Aspergillus udagawae]
MEVKLDMWLCMTKRRDGKEGVFAVRSFRREDSEAVLERCTSLAHPHLVRVYEVFRMESAEESLFVVSEELQFSLDHVVACGEIPTDGELASIMGQILDALSYIHSQSLIHGSLTCSNTLVRFDGVVKIGEQPLTFMTRHRLIEKLVAGYWGCDSFNGSSKHTQDIIAAGHIMMQLMQDHQSTDVDAWRLFYVIAAVFGTNTLLKIGVVLHRNGAFASSWSHGDVIKHADCSMRIEIRPGRPVIVQPGQYIDLWVPSWNPWSWFQSASFIVTSWSTEKQSTLQLYAKCPNRPLGFTWLLLWRALRNSRRNLILFSGPHGSSVPASHYETVLLVASDSGILALRPYVDQLFHCVTKRTSKTRRLCLVWNVTRRSSNHFVSDIFGWVNKLLVNDIDDHTNMLSVKIYNAQRVLKSRPGENGSRGEVIQKPADLPALSSLLAEEVQAHQERITTDDMKERGGMLVMASASGQIVDDLRQSVKAYLTWIHLVELDYQPTVNSTPGLIRWLK